MYSGKGKLHGSRLLCIGALTALIGLSLSVSIVMLKYPRHREVCSMWSAPGTFFAKEPPAKTIVAGGIEKIHESELPGEVDNADDSYKDFLDVIHKGSLGFIPTLPKNTTNAFDDTEIAIWKARTGCLSPLIVDASAKNDPTSQRMIMRVTSAGALITFCCQRTQLELYFPPTISESIRDWSAPEGRIFFGFMIIASVFVLMSFHPYTLSNVCTANDLALGFINTAMLRHIFPPMGLMLVACVPTVPVDTMYTLAPTWTEIMTNMVMFSVHMFGAIGAFVGYAIAEVWALNILPYWCDNLDGELDTASDVIFHKQLLHGKQRILRVLSVLIILAGCGVFSFGFTVVMFAGAQRVVKISEGFLLFFRVVTYFAEAAAAMGLGISLLVIWWYCPERHVVIPIERDIAVLERHMAYLEKMGLSQMPLGDIMGISEGPLREKVDRLEAEIAGQFLTIQREAAITGNTVVYKNDPLKSTVPLFNRNRSKVGKDNRTDKSLAFVTDMNHGSINPLEIESDLEEQSHPLLSQ